MTKKITLLAFIAFYCFSANIVNAQTYCVPSYTTGSVEGDYIANVTLGTINNTTTLDSNNFYIYFNNQSTNVVLNASYTISIKSGLFINDYYSVYIDYNNDGDFNDANDSIGTLKNTVASQLLTIPFTVPSNVNIGTTRLRVFCHYGILDLPCDSTVAYGETEDYNVVISATSNIAPVANFNTSTPTTFVGEVINFTDLSAGTPTSWSWSFPGGTPATSTLQNPVGISYNTAGTYNVTLTATNAIGNNTYTATGYITITLGSLCIDALNPACDSTDFISNVSILNTTLHNTSICDGTIASSYTSYLASDSLTAALTKGQTYTLSVTTKLSNIISCWIDFNRNNILSENEWFQVTQASVADTASTIQIAIPNTAISGVATLRIRSRGAFNPNGATDACTEFFSGETEDYQISIITNQPNTSSIAETQNSNVDFNVFPNPTSDNLNIQISSSINNALVELLDLQGRLIYTQKITNSNSIIDMHNFKNGVYFARLSSDRNTTTRRIVKQ